MNIFKNWNFNRWKLSSKIMVSTIIPLVLIVILSVISYLSILSLEEGDYWVDHTYQVMASAANIQKHIVDMEAGQRGFLITGKETFLAPYNQGKLSLATEVAALKKLVSDSPAQVKRISRVQQLALQWIKEAGMVEINARRNVQEGAKDAAYLQDVLSRST